jgi:hypothetical protein
LLTHALHSIARHQDQTVFETNIRRQFLELAYVPASPSPAPPPPYITPPPQSAPIVKSAPRSRTVQTVVAAQPSLFKDLLDILALGLASVLPAYVCVVVLLLLTIKALLKPRRQ